ncbi:glycyl-radical enzyme activating protein [Desulfoscipio geothermicus]|uniref:Pyruvate formate lyase activating enzyme n=1 Tax=Desulfoscipio geothermicus DSM 3669 TaxID=1121426 RepID=A0A1I6EE70_9FIRM|nr:glycyl-radical enzyme activating protein [Desulfoscipio geothermicus]SFR16056.1 pyruvate formate lyase activating enzyme [Desulfoscipio geothermicus DSM 3669]
MDNDTGSVNHKLGRVFNIQKFSVHDGPGIRDVVFMKGCPLRCLWCCNPESQNTFPEIGYIQNKCIGIQECGYCIKACPKKAITNSTVETPKIDIDRRLCDHCGKCVDVCPARAITLFGQMMSVEDVIKEVQGGNASWRTGGGITVSGGELLLQADFVHDLLKECKKRGIDTAIETSGYGDWRELERICRHCNLIFYDVKCMDSDKHKAFTGVNNEVILDNILKVASQFPETPVIVRTPVIPEFNDSWKDIKAIVEFITQLQNLTEYELMAYHAFGEPKYRQLGRKYRLERVKPPKKEYISDLQQRANAILKKKSYK